MNKLIYLILLILIFSCIDKTNLPDKQYYIITSSSNGPFETSFDTIKINYDFIDLDSCKMISIKDSRLKSEYFFVFYLNNMDSSKAEILNEDYYLNNAENLRFELNDSVYYLKIFKFSNGDIDGDFFLYTTNNLWPLLVHSNDRRFIDRFIGISPEMNSIINGILVEPVFWKRVL